MATTMRVPTIFTAVDKFSDVVNRMSGNVSAFGNTAEAASMRASRKMNAFGNNMLTLGVGMATGIGLAINQASKYETAIASLAAVTGTEVGSMNKYIEDLGTETNRSIIDVAKSFEIVGSKMSQYLKEPEALKRITRSSILMADAARMELEPAIESLTGVMNIFGLAADKADYVVNKLSAGEIVGSIKIAETADILKQFGGAARLANVNVEESVALIQTLTKSLGVEGVGRGIRNLMVDLSMVGAFDAKKQKALESVGVNFKKLADKSLPLIERLQELKKLQGNSAAMGMFFKKTGIQTGATMFQNWGDLERFLKTISETNKAQEQAAKNNATLEKKMKDLKNQIIFLAIKIGQILLPKIHDFINLAIPIIRKIIDWVKRNERLVKTIFYLTLAFLLLGTAAKLGAFYLLGYSRVLKIIDFATKAYTGTVWFLSLGLEGAATAATYAAASLWATIWPLALFGLFVWVIIDMVQHWEDWYEVIGLCIGPLGWVVLLLEKISKHSDNISNKFAFEGWSGGIKAIGVMLQDLILSPLIGIFNILGRLLSFIPGVGSSFKEMAMDLDSVRTKVASEVSIGNATGANQFSTFGGIIPQWNTEQTSNLAGGNQDITQQMMAMLAKGTLDININAPEGTVKNVDDTKSSGVKVNVGSTIGQFGQ